MSELSGDQQRLDRSLKRAQVGEDRELAAKVRDLGENLARQLYGVFRMIRLHELDNQAFEKPVADLLETIAELFDLLGTIYLVAVEDQVYVNDVRVRLDARTDIGRLLGEELRRHRVGGLNIHQPPTAEELRRFVALFAEKPDAQAPRHALQKALIAAGITGVELAGVFRYRISGEKAGVARARNTRRLTSRATGLADVAFNNLASERMPNPLPIRRAVTEILEAGSGSEGLWEEPDEASAYSAHVFRVSLTAMLLGRAIGLADEAVQDLGVAAMFHDVGYAAREGAKPAEGDEAEEVGFPPPFERHPAAGARLLLRQRGFHAAKIHRVLAVLHHHRPLDSKLGRPALFGRIVHVADAYDNLMRPDGGDFNPPDALRCLLRYAGTRYDPLLVQLLINALGRYPPGTFLRLTDGRIVCSCSVARNTATWDRPLTEVVELADGTEPDAPIRVDLAVEGEVAKQLR